MYITCPKTVFPGRVGSGRAYFFLQYGKNCSGGPRQNVNFSLASRGPGRNGPENFRPICTLHSHHSYPSSSRFGVSKLYIWSFLLFSYYNTWTRFYQNTPFYIFEIPPDSGITLKWMKVGNSWDISSIPFKTLWISRNYNIDTGDRHATEDYYNIKDSVTAQFRVVELNVTSRVTVHIRLTNTTVILAKSVKQCFYSN